MSVITLPPIDVKGAYQPAASAVADVHFRAAATGGDTNDFVSTGREIVLVRNVSAQTPVTDEELVAGDTDADEEISGTLASAPTPGSLVITDAVGQTVYDDGNGNLIGDVGSGGSNTVVYSTGVYSFSFAGASTGPVDANYATGTSKTVTVTSVANARNRTGHITAHPVGAGEVVVLPFFKQDGWASGGKIALAGEDANIEIAVLRLPAV